MTNKQKLIRWSAFGTIMVALLWLPIISIYASEKKDTNVVPDQYGNVDIDHILVDGAGKTIDSLTERVRFLDGMNVGVSYTTAPEPFDEYIVYKTPSNANGKVLEGTSTITYKYVEPKLVEEVEGTVVAQYVDESGVEIAERDILTGYLGSPYNTSQKELEGYDLSGVEGSKKGAYEQGLTLVTYEYELKESDDETPDTLEGAVITKYVDVETGNEIAKHNQTSGTLGEAYTNNPKQVHGYNYKNTVEINGDVKNASTIDGEYDKGVATIIYHYEPINEETIAQPFGSVVATHVVDAGMNDAGEVVYKPIAQNDMSVGAIDTQYETLPKGVAGYGFTETIGNTQGLYEEELVEVMYIYDVVDEEDTPIDDSREEVVERDEEDTPIDDSREDVVEKEEEDTPIDDSREDVVEKDEDDTPIDDSREDVVEKDEDDTPIDDSREDVVEKDEDDTPIDDSREDVVEREEDEDENDTPIDEDDTPIDDSREDVVERDDDATIDTDKENGSAPDNTEMDNEEEPSIQRPVQDDNATEQDDPDEIVTSDEPEVDSGSKNVVIGDDFTNDVVENNVLTDDDYTKDVVEKVVVKNNDANSDTNNDTNKNNNTKNNDNKTTKDSVKVVSDKEKDMIPQAGARTNYLTIGAGLLLLSVSAYMLIFRRKEECI